MAKPKPTAAPTTYAQAVTADNNQFRADQRKQALAEAKQAKANNHRA